MKRYKSREQTLKEMDRKNAVLSFIEERYIEDLMVPTYAEILEGTGIGSLSTVHKIMIQLEEAGQVEYYNLRYRLSRAHMIRLFKEIIEGEEAER